MPSLVIEPEGRAIPLVRHITSIGSGHDNDIVVDDVEVADTHAHVRLEAGRFVLVALGRAQRIEIAGKRVRKHPFEHGDRVRLAGTSIRFNLWDDPGTTETTREYETNREDAIKAYETLATFSRTLAETRDVGTLLEALMDQIVALTGAGKGFLLMMDDETPVVRTARNLNKESIAATLDQVSDSIISRVLESRQPIIVSDALNDTHFKSSISVMQLRLCSVMCAPLLFRGELLGLIYVGNDNIVNLFEAQSLEVLRVFASQAALLVKHAMEVEGLERDNDALRNALRERRYGSIIGACDAMLAVFRTVEKVASTDINVLILGETGTGKELIARELHRRSHRGEGRFVAVNCGAIPENLMESELFGHRRGAFTGATETKDGCFQHANGGTLFLDEVGEMPPSLQVKLLRAIQEKVVTRVGENRPQTVDIRVVAATNVDLEQAVRDGKFREDLYYRLNVVGISLPPLRDRDEDVILIARFLLDRFASEYGRNVKAFTRDAIIVIRKHAWPGNIRELENRLRKAVVLADAPQLSPEDLGLAPELVASRVLPLVEAKERFQRRYIDQVLALNNYNRTQTARDLGVDPRTIFRHLEKSRGEDD